MMKLVVFGSTGKVGQQIVAQALNSGYEVTAHARRADKIEAKGANLRIVEGDVLDPASVKEAVAGQDVVLCALGMPLRNKDGLRARGTRHIIEAMKSSNVKRLVCLSGLGAGESLDMLPFHYRYLILPLILRHVFNDHENQEAVVKQSDLDWVLARPGNFTKGAHTGIYKHGFLEIDNSIKIKISPADVADFMLGQVASDAYLHQAPALSY
jgi:putative NADH-flavin reductase